ncbi:MAG: BrnT family toxin [Chloroflexi bacterium]|nr:BrnT family toxin [Chloroflexota bacterium]MBU1662597.1 BrnT family toxin [Chloroflexota bacterium]
MDVHQVFNGPMIINSDDREYYGENRWIGTGFLGNTIVVVVFTEKYKDTIRIISARKANKHERKEFEQELAYRLG